MMDRITCIEVEDLLPRYMAGDLPPDLSGEITAHLAGCQGCSSALGLFTALEHSLSALSDELPEPSAVSAGVVSRLGLTDRKHRYTFTPGLPVFASVTLILLSAAMFLLRGYIVPLYKDVDFSMTSGENVFLDTASTALSGFLSSLGIAYSGITAGIVDYLEEIVSRLAGIDGWILVPVYLGLIMISTVAFIGIIRRVIDE